MSSEKSITSLLPLCYEGQTVRSYVDAVGMVWWVAQDVGTVLAIQNVRQNIDKFPEDEKGVCSTYTPGGPQLLLTVNEPGLYRLIFQSRKPEAEAFKRWVFHDVLPILRRTGTYTFPHPPQAPLSLTSQGQLPPPPPRPREHAEVSEHLLRVWTLLRDTEEWLSNTEIARRADVAPRTARAHTYYLKHLGVIDTQEVFPRHLHRVSEVAARRNAGVYERLNQIATIIKERTSF